MNRQYKLLFLHHNFPAQFRKLILYLAQDGHDVLFLSEKNYVGNIKGIKHKFVKEEKALTTASFQGQLECADRFLQSLVELKNEGWVPEIVVSHSGWGCGLDVNHVFPKALKVTYLEWWFAEEAENYSFDPLNPWISYPPKHRLKMRRRNLTIAQELSESDHIVVPTRWQQRQLPELFKKNSVVIHEGVDCNYFVRNQKWRPINRLRITYATRGMEPMRGFPEFILAVKSILTKKNNVEVIIAGDDRVAYGSNIPKQGSFGRWAKSELSEFIQQQRVSFVGQLSLKHYARLLKSSHLHCYFTRPFIASWSLLEAMASGCCITASKLPVTEEFLSREQTLWVDHTNPTCLREKILFGLEISDEERDTRGLSQREIAVLHWDVKNSIIKWKGLLGI